MAFELNNRKITAK